MASADSGAISLINCFGSAARFNTHLVVSPLEFMPRVAA
jgi:hypothetical protein